MLTFWRTSFIETQGLISGSSRGAAPGQQRPRAAAKTIISYQLSTAHSVIAGELRRLTLTRITSSRINEAPLRGSVSLHNPPKAAGTEENVSPGNGANQQRSPEAAPAEDVDVDDGDTDADGEADADSEAADEDGAADRVGAALDAADAAVDAVGAVVDAADAAVDAVGAAVRAAAVEEGRSTRVDAEDGEETIGSPWGTEAGRCWLQKTTPPTTTAPSRSAPTSLPRAEGPGSAGAGTEGAATGRAGGSGAVGVSPSGEPIAELATASVTAG